MDGIKKAWKNINTSRSRFDELLAKYCPEIPIRETFLGEKYYGESYWKSYTRTAVMPLLIERLAQAAGGPREGEK